jgi:hypothetical protein
MFWLYQPGDNVAVLVMSRPGRRHGGMTELGNSDLSEQG